jgi:hypothetical protein
MKHPLVGKQDNDKRAKDLFASIREKIEKGMPEEQIDNLKILGEKFHESFDVTRGTTRDFNEIQMEEALAYVVESLKSGIHPSYLDENERAIMVAGFGEEWYTKWGYSKKDLYT